LAKRNHIKGWVENRNDGVKIHAEGRKDDILTFLHNIPVEKPLPAKIISLDFKVVSLKNCSDFIIQKSTDYSDEVTEISPDIAVCEACLSDMKTQFHRIRYPFINCTNCGPRFTIIKDLPYDRDKTTMHPFFMCETCKKEYSDVLDRRFHAQPVACNHCGPHYSLHAGDIILEDIEHILNRCSKIINESGIIAIKGMGGFNLCCDALNEEAVSKLRQLKVREGKPFAVMFRDLQNLADYVKSNKKERETLVSWQRPIVLLQHKKPLAFSVSNGLNTTGVLLPYMPFHYLLFEKLKTPALVMTSGNISDEPIIIESSKAINTFNQNCDAVLTYNRDIYNRTDDSVVFIANNKSRTIRRSRGFVPSPVLLDFHAEGIFAAGAELVNTFCIGKGKQALLSQHIGDLKNYETLEFFEESVDRFSRMFRFKPQYATCDFHPDYLSSRYAENTKLPLIKVQHHHAHIASVMAEHSIDEPVIGVAMDGVGLGDDGHIWGAEFFISDLLTYDRVCHFEYVPQPGGDKVTQEPWRMAVSYLYKYLGESFLDLPLPMIRNKGINKVKDILTIIDHKMNSPLSSSAGRLFDAVSALTGICPDSGFHAEAPMRLEATLIPGIKSSYDVELSSNISFRPMFLQMIEDILNKEKAGVISAKFHNTVVNAIHECVMKISKEYGIKKAVLSGGSFQNRYLLEHVEKNLINSGISVFSNEQIPSNDGGIALGQLAVAAKRINSGML